MKIKINYFLCFNLILFFTTSYSCQWDKNKKLENSDTVDTGLKSIVDTLLNGNILNDTVNYDYYLRKNKLTFIKCLIDNIDSDNKIIMAVPGELDVRLSTIPTKSYYIGGRAICLINEIINPRNSNHEWLKNYCVVGLLLHGNTELTLDELKEFKIHSLKWHSNANGISEEEQRASWNKLYSSKFKE